MDGNITYWTERRIVELGYILFLWHYNFFNVCDQAEEATNHQPRCSCPSPLPPLIERAGTMFSSWSKQICHSQPV